VVSSLRRELAEELGYRMETCRLLHAETNRRRRLLILSYLVEADGTFRPSVEVRGLRPWPLDDLPPGLPTEERRALLLATPPE
jgi:hypothetical protein